MIERVAHYRILEPIGAGALGEVYRARDTRAGRTVAIRVLSPRLVRDADLRQRVIAAARLAERLSHPRIAALYEVIEDADGQVILVHEFVAGEALSRAIAAHPLNPLRGAELAAQVADAMAQAHAIGVFHQHLRPEDIVITPKGHAKVLDFGLAPARAALEEPPAEASSGERADIAALGRVVLAMLSGRSHATLPAIDEVISKATDERRQDRYASAAVLAADLRAAAAVLEKRALASQSIPRTTPIARWQRVPARLLTAGAAVVLLLLVLVMAGRWLAHLF